ncbi:FmdB family zinc ribbon protein [Actinomadura sp. WAC 06369]|uniref:FmdB family zinc ribbon protein n=1 Tax=Actinomadura sp. WAC 06369 TaxID=2203193 RepID=UPI000F790FE1|nr:zinc ribbon domain-containing protein [Actinomadura sp. WAC 06369]RSN68983.1 hypothetical protein DMH08_09530 [Actinomadura sp. WAC 06369]
MANYRYRCAECGAFDVARPIGTAEAAEPCPGCGRAAPRVFTPPLVRRTPAALDAGEASAGEPRVVRRDARPRPPAPAADPRRDRLPRP